MAKVDGKSIKISIHALREESDFPTPQAFPPARYFNPRPPRGERRRCTRKATQ